MRSNKLLLGVVAVAAAAGVYWFLLLAPKREEASTLAGQVSTKQSQVAQAETTLASYRTAAKSYKSNYATVARLGKAVPADDDVRSLVIQLEAAADDAKVDFRSIEVSDSGASTVPGTAPSVAVPPGATAGADGFATMPFALEFTGNYMRLSHFFTKLERFVQVHNEKIDVKGRLLRLENIKLTPSPDGYPSLSAKVTATSYLTPASTDVAGGATAAAPGTTPAAPAGGTTTPVTPATVTGALR